VAVLIVPVVVKYNVGKLNFEDDPVMFIGVLAGIGLMIFALAYAVLISKRTVSKSKKPKRRKNQGPEPIEPAMPEGQ
jgi:hypothetical protein